MSRGLVRSVVPLARPSVEDGLSEFRITENEPETAGGQAPHPDGAHVPRDTTQSDLAPPPLSHLVAADATSEPVKDALPPDDLAPRIEALKSFLARYPARRPADAPGDAANATTNDSKSPASTAPQLPEPSSPDSASGEPRTTFPLSAPADRVSSPEPDAVRSDRAANSETSAPSVVHARHGAVAVRHPSWDRRWVAAAIAPVVVAIGIAITVWLLPAAGGATTGSLTVETNPVGITVLVDGTAQGATPITINLPPGEHVLELALDQERRRIPVNITAGGQVSHFLELARAAASHGELQVRTEPSGVSVTVDGQFVGESPVSVSDLSPGPHTVVLSHASGTVTENVVIESGRTASLVVPMTGSPAGGSLRASPAAGWISVSAPADVQVFENGQLVGSSSIERIMLPVGRHDLEFVSETLGFRGRQTVQVTPGQVSTVTPEWPRGTLALNALPWAEVWIDGARVGETPIGGMSVPIGTHEVIFRHPELGERRATITVTAREPAKIGVDLTSR